MVTDTKYVKADNVMSMIDAMMNGYPQQSLNTKEKMTLLEKLSDMQDAVQKDIDKTERLDETRQDLSEIIIEYISYLIPELKLNPYDEELAKEVEETLRAAELDDSFKELTRIIVAATPSINPKNTSAKISLSPEKKINKSANVVKENNSKSSKTDEDKALKIWLSEIM